LTNININKKNFYNEIKRAALKNKQEEVCGLIIKNSLEELLVLECENIFEKKQEGFVISPEVFLNILNKNCEIIAIYHSHPNSGCAPSKTDIAQSEALCLPFIIYSLKNDDFYINIPQSYQAKDFLSRIYIDGIQNCISLAVDFYKKFYNFNASGFNFYLLRDGEDNDWKINFQKLLSVKNLFKQNKFIKKSKLDLQDGDLIIFQYEKNQIHLGICVDGEKVLHHPFYGLSVETFLCEEIKRNIHSVYRKSV
jgi:proteasome lid subunit RPN8/RPN11